MEVVKEGVGKQIVLAEKFQAPAWLGKVDLRLLIVRTGVGSGWGGSVEVYDGLHGEVVVDL